MTRAITAAVAALVSLAALAGCAVREPVDLPPADTYALQVFDLTNELRRDEGQPALVWSRCLEAQAIERAVLLLTEDDLTHRDLEASCGDYDYAGENLTRGDRAPADVLQAWEDSPGHRANLADPDFEVGAVGCVAVAFDDHRRQAEPGEPIAGMSCSFLMQGYVP